MRQPRCPRCQSESLSLFATGDLEWDGTRWEPNGVFHYAWLSCECGHTWRTQRKLHILQEQLGLELP